MFKVEIPRILFLALDIAGFYRNSFFNTNDLAQLANRYKGDLVRSKLYKKDYKYLDDTRFGGLRGNFSTLLTWRGLVKRGSTIVNTYSLGRDGRLVNAVCNGRIILNREEKTAYTNDESLRKILELESWLRNVRESQAHVKTMLGRNSALPLERDNVNYPKKAVFKSDNGQYFIRGLVNNFVDTTGNILQFYIGNLWEGTKFRKNNIHPLLVLPTKGDPWGGGIFAIRVEELLFDKPLLLTVDLTNHICRDEKEKEYKLVRLEEALMTFSKENANIEVRLNHNWANLQQLYCENEVDNVVRKEDEFSNFLRMFLDWNRSFSIDGKDVINIKVISSGGPDVELEFSGGTIQKLELEHRWSNYLAHGHHTNNAFQSVWMFAEEEFDFKKIEKLFYKQRVDHGVRIPDVFLSVSKDKTRHAHRINWEERAFEEIALSFTLKV